MTLTTHHQHAADRRARTAYETADVNPYAIAEDADDPLEADHAAREAMFEATGNAEAADMAGMNAREYFEEVAEDER